jgi:hypothetical protein
MTLSWAELAVQVEDRAGGRCEYCLMHQFLQGATFHIEHILPKSDGGSDSFDNLAWACPSCNLRKSNRRELSDAQTGTTAPLFNPRILRWSDHFAWDGYSIIGLTPVGRALVDAFDLNHERRLLIRHAEEMFGLFPPSFPDQ